MSHDDAGRPGPAGDTGSAAGEDALFRALFEQAADGLFVAGPDGVLEAVNPAGAEMIGLDPAELAGVPLADLFPAEDLRRQPIAATSLPPGGVVMVERRLVRKGGGLTPVEVNARVLSDGRILGVVRDISERRQVEESLLRHRQAVQSSINGIAFADLDGRLTYVNPGFLRLWGYADISEVVGRDAADFWESGSAAREVMEGLQSGDGGWVGELTARRRDGSSMDVQLSASLIRDTDGAPAGMMGVFVDVTERRRNEVRVAALARLYALLSRVNSVLMRSRDPTSMLKDVCDVAVEQGGFRMAWIGMLAPESSRVEPLAWAGHEDGYLALAFSSDPAESAGSGPTGSAVREGHLVTCEDIATDPRMEAWRDAALPRGYRSSAAVPLRRHGEVVGSLNLYAAEVGFFTASEQKLLGEIGDAISYTLDALDLAVERTAMEAALRVSEDRLREVVNTSHIGIFDHDRRSGEIYWSQQQRALYGFDPDEPVTLESSLAGVHPDDRDWIKEALARAHDPTGDGLLVAEHRIIARDGETRWVMTRSQTFFEDGRPVRTVGGVRDVTEEKRAHQERQELQDRLTQARKMEVVGRLAGGVAHDFNNMLGVIIGHADLALAQLEPGDPVRDDLEQIQHAALRSSDLTRQLLAFARRQPIVPRVLDLNDAVASSLKLVRRLVGEHVELAWMPGADLWTVHVDPTQVVQILTNLVVNARDAMGGIGGTGRVVIRTTNDTLEEDFAASHPEISPGPYVALSVEDEGTGIEEDILHHVFEPFFTTKEDSHGTGLGLATVYGIARQNDGLVTVESHVGRGTTVRVYLPKCDAPAPEEAEETEPPGLPEGDETVLLVEDEAALLGLARRALETAGYQVLGAASPSEALELLEREKPAVDAAVLDVIMPGMSGADLSRKLVEMRPGLRCLFISGYPFDLVSNRNLLPPGVAFLQKPFTGHDLAVRVREMLDRT